MDAPSSSLSHSSFVSNSTSSKFVQRKMHLTGFVFSSAATQITAASNLLKAVDPIFATVVYFCCKNLLIRNRKLSQWVIYRIILHGEISIRDVQAALNTIAGILAGFTSRRTTMASLSYFV